MRLVKVVSAVFLASSIFAAGSTVGAEPAAAKPEKPKLRVGTFNSRALAIAYARSEIGSRYLKGLLEQHKKAKAAGDSKKVEQLEAEGKAQQDRLHQQGFSTAPVDNILEHINDKLPNIAKQAGVDVIVSKWAIAYRAADAEFVDVTDLMVQPFAPDEKTLRSIKEMEKHAPVRLDKLKIETHE